MRSHIPGAAKVGIAEIDEQHEQLRAVVALVAAHPEAAVDSELIAEALHKLTWYGDAHFRTEETLLQHHGCPELDAHVAGHRLFRRRIAELCIAASAGVGEVPALLREFVTGWWSEHVLANERHYTRPPKDRSPA